MAEQLFPVFDLPEIPDDPEYEERYRPSVAFDFEKGDFVRDGSNKMVRADGREAYMQWCWKVVQTEREAFLAYSDEIGTEFEIRGKVRSSGRLPMRCWFILRQSTFEILFLTTALETQWFRSLSRERSGKRKKQYQLSLRKG